ncbi:MAG TPA: hypothetical protein PK098_13575 [Phycisphaerales bacterium]|nr:hypothetical protein [Phycisphaerales bacterium]
MHTVMALEQELKTYERELETLLAHEGQYALIAGDEVLGIFAVYEEALREGYDRVGVKPFLVKKIETVERLFHFSRDLVNPCHT